VIALPTREEVFEGVKKAIKATLPGVDLETVTEETRFIEDLDADSLDLVELVMAAEDALGTAYDLGIFELTDEEVDQMTTVGRAIDVVLEKLKGILSTSR